MARLSVSKAKCCVKNLNIVVFCGGWFALPAVCGKTEAFKICAFGDNEMCLTTKRLCLVVQAVRIAMYNLLLAFFQSLGLINLSTIISDSSRYICELPSVLCLGGKYYSSSGLT